MNILANGRAIRVNNMLTTLPIPCAYREIAHLGKRLMPFFRNPLLVVWEAMNLLAEEDALSRCASDKALITDAETVLCRLTMELLIEQNIQGSICI
jgi:hypothetical protein